jgi:hypothetical protein
MLGMIVTTRKTGQKTDSVMASIGPVVTGPERAVYVDSEASFGYAVGRYWCVSPKSAQRFWGNDTRRKNDGGKKEQRS